MTEELTKERRSAYAKVLAEAGEIAAGRAADHHGFERAVREAEFLSSEQMYDARCLPALLVGVGEEGWKGGSTGSVNWLGSIAIGTRERVDGGVDAGIASCRLSTSQEPIKRRSDQLIR